MIIKEDFTNQQKTFQFKLSADSIEELRKIVDYVQQNSFVKDEKGNNMLFKAFDPNRIEL